MAQIEQSIEVNVPVDTAYNQWTQFEEFPQFMEGVERVKQIDETRLHWEAQVAGKREEWDAEITEQIPDERIAWTAREGKGNSGVVTFHRLAPGKTKIMLQLDWNPQGLVEKVGSAVGADESRVKGDLERFKGLIESRGQESGAWRGEVQQGDVVNR